MLRRLINCCIIIIIIKHSLSINYTNFEKDPGLGLVLVSKDSRVHNPNLTVRSACILVLRLLFLTCPHYYLHLTKYPKRQCVLTSVK